MVKTMVQLEVSVWVLNKLVGHSTHIERPMKKPSSYLQAKLIFASHI